MSIPTRVTRPLRSTRITPSHRYYGAVRPCSAHRYCRPRGASAWAFSLSITDQVSQVPYESPDEIHASYTPDIAWPVSRSLPCCSRNKRDIPVLMSSEFDFDALSEVRLHSSLSSLHDVIIVTPFNHNVHHRSFWLKQLMAV
jgi:hypothetical protein